ncbi:hypothetical protein JCM9534A_28500 [Catenuloplanes indicus JCM 9534]|uniref:Membrane protein YdfJ with MMPL/SSD domain n=1 Tax=Catenuloplanes indicus TaxID=137267 RepID=A0AAE3VZS0_9ACTN|nr:putative membrane protein YdfJ with MMPL/SSD domain [Catenuloplanes indicus]
MIAARLRLLPSGRNSNRALGPISAVGVAATLIAMIPLLPALLLGGRWAFWPRRPPARGTTADSRLWTRVAGAVEKRPRVTWIDTAVLRGPIITGCVITSAGVVLAATFSALAVVPPVTLAELGTAVAVGVPLDTVVVRSLPVPALVHDLGDRVRWPGRPPRRTPGRSDGPDDSAKKDGRLISV